eukprot:2549038-Rhodomonas_salina.4
MSCPVLTQAMLLPGGSPLSSEQQVSRRLSAHAMSSTYLAYGATRAIRDVRNGPGIRSAMYGTDLGDTLVPGEGGGVRAVQAPRGHPEPPQVSQLCSYAYCHTKPRVPEYGIPSCWCARSTTPVLRN